MHVLFENILATRDLSKAGELFAVEDYLIVDGLTDVLLEIAEIIAQPQYLDSPNDQSVIEICVNRCTSCIRETNTAEQHCAGLVQVLETCHKYGHKPSSRGEDPPHAKLSSDLVSCLFLNYNKRPVMERTLPVAVRFLTKENREMSRNLASYLSLAAIEHADLLVPHVDTILRALLNGTHSLARVLLQLHEAAASETAAVAARSGALIDCLGKCDDAERNHLLQLVEAVVVAAGSDHCAVVVDRLPQFFDLLLTANSTEATTTAQQTLSVLLVVARKKPAAFNEYVGLLILTAQKNPSTIPLVGQLLAAIGTKNKEKAYVALEFIMEHLPLAERASQTTLLQEAVKLCSQYPILFNDKLTAVIRQRHLSSNSSIHHGNVTRVSLNHNNNNHINNGSIPVIPQAAAAAVVPTTMRRNKFDSRSTNRLHSAGSNSITVNASHLAGNNNLSCVRLSSSQHIHQLPSVSRHSATIPPPLSSNVIITGENKFGLPSTKVTTVDGLVTASHHRRAGTFFGSSNGISINQSIGNIHHPNNHIISVHHVTPSTTSLASPPPPPLPPVTSPPSGSAATAATAKIRNNNKSVTLLNASTSNGGGGVSGSSGGGGTFSHRMSVFEPSVRDTIQHFCEKHLGKIKAYMRSIYERLPPAAKCTIEERKSKKFAKIHFACQARSNAHCLYSKTFFSTRTKFAKTWIHLMFLDLQSRAEHALSSYDPSVSSLKHCWDTLRIENKTTFITLVTSAFPPHRELDALLVELRHSGYFDVFERGRAASDRAAHDDLHFACFLCSHPEKATLFIENRSQPVIEGQLKEKKGKWRLFKRWRTRYFTLSGAQLSYKNSSGDSSTQTTLDVDQIRSVKVSRSARNIPTCFEIFTGNQTLVLKPTNVDKAEEWVQYLSIVVAKHNN